MIHFRFEACSAGPSPPFASNRKANEVPYSQIRGCGAAGAAESIPRRRGPSVIPAHAAEPIDTNSLITSDLARRFAAPRMSNCDIHCKVSELIYLPSPSRATYAGTEGLTYFGTPVSTHARSLGAKRGANSPLLRRIGTPEHLRPPRAPLPVVDCDPAYLSYPPNSRTNQ
jgi:hypothetical protein